METKEIKPFATDGCSGGMSWFSKHILKRQLPWEDACIVHDEKYWRGGTRNMRKSADADLLRAVVQTGHPYCAMVMYVTVRVFGSPWMPLPWRWGFGYEYGHGYNHG